MSSIIRHVRSAPTILIGEQQRDAVAEAKAEKTLGALFPMVSVMTAVDGSKLIPIEQVFKIEDVYQRELQRARKEGFAEGHKRGYREGLELGRDEARKVLATFDAAIKDTVSQRESILQEAKQKILELVVQISRKVTFEAIDIDRESTAQLIAGVIDTLVDRSKLKIKVHPDHLPVVEQNIDRFLVNSTAIKELTIEPDPRVRFGGCFIETPNGDVDARLESQFEVIAESVRAAEDQS
ncbi:MAG: FliH/SctL family protein [candidate division Zixibacteria bacterium]|nr:FliH/SctL family protein [candidate division Zixibacteria bacterium]